MKCSHFWGPVHCSSFYTVIKSDYTVWLFTKSRILLPPLEPIMVCAASVLEGMDLTDAFSVVGSILKMSRPLNHTGVSHKCELSDMFLKNRDLRGTVTYTLKQD